MLQHSALSSEHHWAQASHVKASAQTSVSVKLASSYLHRAHNWTWTSALMDWVQKMEPTQGGLVIRKLLSCFVSSWVCLLATAVSHFKPPSGAFPLFSSVLHLCLCWRSCLCVRWTNGHSSTSSVLWALFAWFPYWPAGLRLLSLKKCCIKWRGGSEMIQTVLSDTDHFFKQFFHQI